MPRTKKNLVSERNGNQIQGNRLENYLKASSNGHENGVTKAKQKEELDKSLKAQPTGRTQNQKRYLANIAQNKLTIVTGPPGSGKTCLSVGMASKYLSDNVVERIIIVRPLISCDEEIGFLPGTLNEKADPFMRPIFDEFSEFFSGEQIGKFVAGRRPIIEIVPLAVMKGRTFKKAFIIFDEAQDATYKQIKMLLTRMGEASKIVITGDVTQTDRDHAPGDSPLENIMAKLRDAQGIAFSELDPGDIQRDPMVALILERI